MHRANLLAGVQDESDEEEGEEPLTNVEAERRARKEAVSAFHALADSDDEDGYDEEDGFLTKRTKDAEEVAGDDAAYRAFLLEMGGGEDEVRRTLGMGDAPATGFREDVESDAEAEEAKEEKGEKASKKDRKKKAEDKAARDEARRVKRAQADEDFLME
jgi:protein KRI1